MYIKIEKDKVKIHEKVDNLSLKDGLKTEEIIKKQITNKGYYYDTMENFLNLQSYLLDNKLEEYPVNTNSYRFNKKEQIIFVSRQDIRSREDIEIFENKKSLKINKLYTFIKNIQKIGLKYKNQPYLITERATNELSKLNIKFDKKKKLGQTFQYHWYNNRKEKTILSEKEFDELAILIGDQYEKIADFKIKMSNKIHSCTTEQELNQVDFDKEWNKI